MNIIRLCIILTLLFLIFNTHAQQYAHIHINLDRTIQRINDSLKKHTDHLQQVRLRNDSTFEIYDNEGLRFIIRAFELKEGIVDRYHWDGIEFEPQRPLSKTMNSFIHFHQKAGGFIKFNGTDDVIVERIWRLFLQMRNYMYGLKRLRERHAKRQ